MSTLRIVYHSLWSFTCEIQLLLWYEQLTIVATSAPPINLLVTWTEVEFLS